MRTSCIALLCFAGIASPMVVTTLYHDLELTTERVQVRCRMDTSTIDAHYEFLVHGRASTERCGKRRWGERPTGYLMGLHVPVYAPTGDSVGLTVRGELRSYYRGTGLVLDVSGPTRPSSHGNVAFPVVGGTVPGLFFAVPEGLRYALLDTIRTQNPALDARLATGPRDLFTRDSLVNLAVDSVWRTDGFALDLSYHQASFEDSLGQPFVVYSPPVATSVSATQRVVKFTAAPKCRVRLLSGHETVTMTDHAIEVVCEDMKPIVVQVSRQGFVDVIGAWLKWCFGGWWKQ